MFQLINDATTLEVQDTPILESLLLNPDLAPMLSEVRTCDLMAVAVWYLWWERYRATHGKTLQAPMRTVPSIMDLALNYKRAKRRGPCPIERHGWTKKSEDMVKLNVDAAFDINTGIEVTGAIIRDHFGVSYFLWKVEPAIC